MKQMQTKIGQYLSLIIGLFLSATAFNLFFRPTNLAYGGSNGVAIIVELLTKGIIGADITIAVFYILTFIVGFLFLGKKTMIRSIIGTIIYPIFVSVTSPLASLNFFDFKENLLVIYIFGALIAGLGSGLVYRTGYSGGGTDIVRLIMYKYLKISLGKAGLIINGIIVVTGAILTQSFSNIMYAFLVLYIMSFVTDRIIIGVSSSKMFYIVSDKADVIKDFITKELEHTATLLNGYGTHGNIKKQVLLCVVPTKQYFILKEVIKTIDNKAFFLITDSYEVSGGM